MKKEDTNIPTIQNLTKILDKTVDKLEYDGTLNNLDALKSQIQTLHNIHTLMLSESKPWRDGAKHSEGRLSLALRAQNQFCRSLLLLNHLEGKAATPPNSKTN